MTDHRCWWSSRKLMSHTWGVDTARRYWHIFWLPPNQVADWWAWPLANNTYWTLIDHKLKALDAIHLTHYRFLMFPFWKVYSTISAFVTLILADMTKNSPQMLKHKDLFSLCLDFLSLCAVFTSSKSLVTKYVCECQVFVGKSTGGKSSIRAINRIDTTLFSF